MAIEKQYEPATPIDGLVEMDPEPDLDIEIETTETDDGGMIIDFDPSSSQMNNADFNSNLVDFIDEDELTSIGNELISAFQADKDSRSEWEETYVKGLDQLGLKIEERTTPWNGACGVFHPMLSEAVVKFQSQAISEIFPASGPVRTKIVGNIDYLLTYEMTEYRSETEKMLFSLPLAGSAFRKVYFDPTLNRPSGIFVPAEDVVVNYGASDLETCERATHVMKKSSNDIRKMQVNGFYRNIELPDATPTSSDITKKYNEMTGESESYSYDTRHTILEMQVDLDLKGFEDKDASGQDNYRPSFWDYS